jgi:N-acetylneuraminic acid mutarotase
MALARMRSFPTLFAAILGLVCLAPGGAATGKAPAAVTTLADDLRAIEAIRWGHRLWPAGNPGPKPALDQALPPESFAARADDEGRRLTALQTFWGRSISEREVQAELDRMARETHAPEVLRQVFATLGDDPDRIARALVLPALTDRLVHRLYARDAALHEATRHGAERALRRFQDPAEMRRLASSSRGEYGEMTYVERRGDETEPAAMEAPTREAAPAPAVPLEPEALARLEAHLAHAGTAGRLEETDDDLHLSVVLERAPGLLRVATVTWRKTPFEEWWQGVRGDLEPAGPARAAHYVLPAISGQGCTEQTWSPIHPPMPDARGGQVAVWTGSEMIVWGGQGPEGFLDSGLRYDPVNDTWTPIPGGAPAPAPRVGATAVWTGTEMIVWGGSQSSGPVTSGGRFNPTTGLWSPTRNDVTTPAGRTGPTAIWTGSEMILWGGADPAGGSPGVVKTGGRYNPASDTWTPTAIPAISPRADHTAVWTGSEMIVFGGYYLNNPTDPVVLTDGGRYNPATDAWVGFTVPGSFRRNHRAVWTGSEMIVWGGKNWLPFARPPRYQALNTGSRYNPETSATVATRTDTTTPPARADFVAVWTGSRMVLWGGSDLVSGVGVVTGGVYDPATDTWTRTRADSTTPAWSGGPAGVWTGTEVIVWGGGGGSNGFSSAGARYNPASDTWTPTGTDGTPLPVGMPAVWTGNEMIVYGAGVHALYEPATDSWRTMPPDSANVGLGQPTLVWTGSEAIAFGWYYQAYAEMVRYDPTLDSVLVYYLPSVPNAPGPRQYHTAVWTGSEMIIWGGSASGAVNNGARYSPATDSWTPTRQDATTPSARFLHTAVWTGSDMLVWGGQGSSGLYETLGGRYHPSTDSWQPIPGGALPRVQASGVWTGSEMIVWGGSSSAGSPLNTGDRYDPVANAWQPTAVDAMTPSVRTSHSAVWTGSRMIVWGGSSGSGTDLANGGAYDPIANSWTAIPDGNGAPSARNRHAAVWTGTDMIVWGGGSQTTGPRQSGALYCGCAAGNFYRDADSDGRGDPLRMSCGPAAGYVPSADDCDDASAVSWANPDEARDLMFTDATTLVWNAPAALGGVAQPIYDVLRAAHLPQGADSFACVGSDLGGLSASDAAIPPAGQAFFYQVRAQNACPGGLGPLGLKLTNGVPMVARSCP